MYKLYEQLELTFIQFEEDVITASELKVDVSGWGEEFDFPID